MTTIAGWLTIINLLVLIGGSIAGFFTVRSAISKANSDTQERVRNALHDENELLQARVQRVEKENRRLDRLMQLLVVMLKKTYDIDLEIDEDVLIFRSKSGTHIGRLDDIQAV